MIAKPFLACCALVALAAAAPGQVMAARGSWAALRFASGCEALARPLAPASERQREARAGFRFGSGRHGHFFVRLSRTARPGATALLHVGEQPFLLAVRGDWAWSPPGGQAAAIIAAVRANSGMRVESRDVGGRRFVDRYLLDGAPTAIDAAAAGCAGKI